MKKSSKSSGNKWIDVLFILACFAGAAFGFWLFWTDITQVLLKRTEEPVGMLSYKRHVVQRRFGDRLMWNQIPRESPVYNGDLVRTSDLSDAVITFDSEDSVRLAENSLIHIRYDKEADSFIELLSGDISLVSTSGKIGVISGNQKLVPVSGGILNVRRGPAGTEARSLTGRTEIFSPDGVIRSLEIGQTARAGGEGSVDIAEDMVVLRPLPNQELRADTNPMPVPFSWTGDLSPAEYVRIEVAGDRGFTDLVYAENEYYEAGTVVPLPPGIWWWRVFRGEQGSSLPPSAAQGRLTILEPLPPPEPEAVFVPLLLPAASDAEGSSVFPVLHSVPAASLAETPVETPPALLSAPDGLFPPSGTVIDPVFLRTGARIVFSWDLVDEANAYIVTIRRGLTVNLYMVMEPRFIFTNLASMDNGVWTWQVEAISLDSSGGIRRHGESAGSVFRLAVPRPETPQVDNPGIIYER
jgi:hypothetical protein